MFHFEVFCGVFFFPPGGILFGCEKLWNQNEKKAKLLFCFEAFDPSSSALVCFLVHCKLLSLYIAFVVQSRKENEALFFGGGFNMPDTLLIIVEAMLKSMSRLCFPLQAV
jgi:hypothetical protein